MRNRSLVQDYLDRCRGRLKAIQVLLAEKLWADVVRESQEVVELSLKALLRHGGIEVPRVHDVSDILVAQAQAYKGSLAAKEIERMAKISRTLRRDRELAFYGSEDLTPSEFYKEADASQAFADAEWLVKACRKACGLP